MCWSVLSAGRTTFCTLPQSRVSSALTTAFRSLRVECLANLVVLRLVFLSCRQHSALINQQAVSQDVSESS